MSATEDKEIEEMMAQNRKGRLMYAIIAGAALILTIAAAVSYFGSVAPPS